MYINTFIDIDIHSKVLHVSVSGLQCSIKRNITFDKNNSKYDLQNLIGI